MALSQLSHAAKKNKKNLWDQVHFPITQLTSLTELSPSQPPPPPLPPPVFLRDANWTVIFKTVNYEINLGTVNN